MARHIAEGFMTVPWVPGGDPGALDLASNLSALAFLDDRTFWDEFCARHGLSDNADEREFFSRCTRPWLEGFSSPGGYARAASDDDPMFGCILDADIPEFEPPHRVLEWPVVPTGDYAPGTFNRRDYYLARLGPWARVVHSPHWERDDDTLARCGRRIQRDMALAMVWPPPAAELGGLPWQWCRECWAGRCISRGDHENDLTPELE
ncbi:Gcsh [Symbiodinium sp. KB8]|nr:Gcsh [Symbiodinium sp. KB8]